ncbi:MAG: hypothetical protein ACTJHC_05975 [Vagococcus sp.]
MTNKKNRHIRIWVTSYMPIVLSLLFVFIPVAIGVKTKDWVVTSPFLILFLSLSWLCVPSYVKEKINVLRLSKALYKSQQQKMETQVQQDKKELLDAYDTEIYRLAMQRKDLEIEILGLKDDRRALINGIETYKLNFNDQVYQYKIQKDALDDVVNRLALQQDFQRDVAKRIFSSSYYESFLNYLVENEWDMLQKVPFDKALDYLKELLQHDEYDSVIINRHKDNQSIHLIAETAEERIGFFYVPEQAQLSKKMLYNLDKSKAYFKLDKTVLMYGGQLTEDMNRRTTRLSIDVWGKNEIRFRLKAYQHDLIKQDKQLILKP